MPATQPIDEPKKANVTPEPVVKRRRSRGFWGEAWYRFRRRKLAMTAFSFIVLLAIVALLSPAIAGTKPIIVKYKGEMHFPALGYFSYTWESVFIRDQFYNIYPGKLKEKDPESWAVWPLVYQDPFRRVGEGEWSGPPVTLHQRVVAWYERIFLDDSWNGQPANQRYSSPNRYNLLGTTNTGSDVFAQMIHGTRIALLVGFVSTGIAALIGVTLGAIAGFFGGWIDMVLSRLIEVVMCIPSLVFILFLIAVLEEPTIWHLMAVLGVTGWTSIARLTRGEFIKLNRSEYITAARALGVGRARIMFRHILPNSLAPVLVPISFGIAAAVLIESGLSFLGFGAPPPNPSWGTLLNIGRNNLQMWWLILFPGTAIFLTVLAYNLIGEGVQEATDPRLRQARQ